MRSWSVSPSLILTSTIVTLAVMAAISETCTAWTVFSIFMGRDSAIFLSLAVFHFSISDTIYVFEATCRELAGYLELPLHIHIVPFFFWTVLYGLFAYASFCLLLPFSFMHNSFQMSVFMYAYFSKFHALIPPLVHVLVMPAALTVTLNAFSKVCSCLSACAHWVNAHKRASRAQQSAYDFVFVALTYVLCAFLTLTFSESVYLSMHYGVAHYLIMQNAQFALTHLQETFLLAVISLSTFKTMFSVASALTGLFKQPVVQSVKAAQHMQSLSFSELLVRLWGYGTVVVRAMVRGVQTASLGQGFKQVAVNVVDKGRNNATAEIILRAQPTSIGAHHKLKKNDRNTLQHRYQDLIRSLKHTRMI